MKMLLRLNCEVAGPLCDETEAVPLRIKIVKRRCYDGLKNVLQIIRKIRTGQGCTTTQFKNVYDWLERTAISYDLTGTNLIIKIAFRIYLDLSGRSYDILEFRLNWKCAMKKLRRFRLNQIDLEMYQDKATTF